MKKKQNEKIEAIDKTLENEEDNAFEVFAKKSAKKTKAFVSDFKKFAFKGNIIDLAIAVVIGNAFSAIVTSLVKNIIMPLISLLIGDVNFADLKIILKEANPLTGGAEIAFGYGMFLQKIFEFLIIALSIFIVFRIVIKTKAKFADKEEKPQKQASTLNKSEVLLGEIRDLLIQKNQKPEQIKKEKAVVKSNRKKD